MDFHRYQAGKAGAPIIKFGGVSNKSVDDWRLVGGSYGAPWADTLDKAFAARGKGGKKSISTATAAANVAHLATALNATIAERSHECKILECRMPAMLKPPHGKSSLHIRHICLVKNTRVEGLSRHLCGTCHRSGTDCRSPVCQSRKCDGGKKMCAHLHDGSGKSRV